MNISRFFNGEKLPSIINDPFDKKCIDSVSMHISRNYDKKSYRFWGYVEFENGNTKGKQSFDAETFDELYLKIKAMIDNL